MIFTIFVRVYSTKHNIEVKGILFAVSSGWYSRSSKNNVSSSPLFMYNRFLYLQSDHLPYKRILLKVFKSYTQLWSMIKDVAQLSCTFVKKEISSVKHNNNNVPSTTLFCTLDILLVALYKKLNLCGFILQVNRAQTLTIAIVLVGLNG